jgi:hypothetical protein
MRMHARQSRWACYDLAEQWQASKVLMQAMLVSKRSAKEVTDHVPVSRTSICLFLVQTW